MMRQLLLLLAFLIVAAIAKPTCLVCDVDACTPPLTREDTTQVMCRKFREAVACATTNLLYNPDCPDNTKKKVRKDVQIWKIYINRNCIPPSIHGVCDVLACIKTIPNTNNKEEISSWMRNATACAITTLYNNNTACSDTVKEEVERVFKRISATTKFKLDLANPHT